MAQYFEIHPDNPQPRLIRRAVDILCAGGVIVYPTDSSYALGCRLGDKLALDRMRRIRRLDDDHFFALICRDLSEIATYAKVDNQAFRLIKSLTPGPYTFVHTATKQVPRRLLHPRRKAIGMRVPDNQICHDLLGALDEPLLSTTLTLPDDELPMTDPYEIRERLDKLVDLVIDGGVCGLESTTVVDMTVDPPALMRRGKGDATPFELPEAP